uniref:Uncharacterized protein n=1 Tax=Romanomermis culicivorax TaxID=13658 RepID=A0A915HG82_ROMCU
MINKFERLTNFLYHRVDAKLFSNDSEFDDDKSEPTEVYSPVMNITKLKLSKQFKLMQKFMKANTRALRVEISSGGSPKSYVQIQGAELQLTCLYRADSDYTTNEENVSLQL